MLRIAGYWGPEVGEGDGARRWEPGGREKNQQVTDGKDPGEDPGVSSR